jgi:hypothetical protein
MRRTLYLGVLLLAATAGCVDGNVTGPADTQPQPAVAGGGSCQGVQGVWSEAGNPVTGQFSGSVAGDLVGTTESLAIIVPPGFTGRAAHGQGTHTLTLDGGGVLELESKWVIANGILNSSYKVVAGGRGSLIAHGAFIPSNLVLSYHGSICR